MFTVTELIDIAIKIEQNGEVVYRESAKKVTNPEFASLLTWMADQEVDHAQLFSQMKSAPGISDDPIPDEALNMALIETFIMGQSFSLSDKDFSNFDQFSQILASAIEFEEDTILFYQMLQTFVSGEREQKQIDMMIAEETKHVALLKSNQPVNT
ncbi:MAG: ferritin family protein [Deltaproteobacteria bacterium]|nr:ferritin family protein [Deltaproteobacteria bacterium]